MGKRIITTENLEEDVKIESSLDVYKRQIIHWASICR